MKDKKLSAMQNQFCFEYAACNEGKASAIKAGYASSSAEVTASKLLRIAKVQEEIKRLRSEQEKRTLVTADFVILGLKEVAERCLQRVAVMEFDYTKKRLVQKMELDSKGNEIGVWEFDSAGANKAFELLGKHLDLFKGSDNQPINVTVTIKQVP